MLLPRERSFSPKGPHPPLSSLVAGGPFLGQTCGESSVLWAHSGLAGTGMERPQLTHDTAEGNRGSQSRARRPPAPFTPPRPGRSCRSAVCAEC